MKIKTVLVTALLAVVLVTSVHAERNWNAKVDSVMGLLEEEKALMDQCLNGLRVNGRVEPSCMESHGVRAKSEADVNRLRAQQDKVFPAIGVAKATRLINLLNAVNERESEIVSRIETMNAKLRAKLRGNR